MYVCMHAACMYVRTVPRMYVVCMYVFSLSHTHTLCKCVSVCLYNAIMLFVCVSVCVSLSLSLCINVYIHTLHMGEERDCMINDQPDIKTRPLNFRF